MPEQGAASGAVRRDHFAEAHTPLLRDGETMAETERDPFDQRAVKVRARVRQIEPEEDAARPFVPYRRALTLKVRQDHEAPGAHLHLACLLLERVPVDPARARATEPLQRRTAQGATEREPAIAAHVVTIHEARVEAGVVHRHQEISGRPQHEARLALVHHTDAQCARCEVASARDDRRSLSQARDGRGLPGDRADHVVRARDPRQHARLESRRARRFLGPNARARVEQRSAEHRGRRVARGLTGQSHCHERVRLEHQRSAFEDLRFVCAQPGELRSQVVRVHPVAPDGLGASRTERAVERAGLRTGAYVEPENRAPERAPILIDQHRGGRLAGHPHSLDTRERRALPDAADDGARGVPPRFGVRFDASLPAGVRRARLVGLCDDTAKRVDDCATNPGRPDVDAEQPPTPVRGRHGQRVSPVRDRRPT